MDNLLDGELVEFEKWFIERQLAKGNQATGLLSAERGIIKAYFIYACTKTSGV